MTKSSQKSCRGYLLQLVQSICKSPLTWVLRPIAGILMPLVFLSEQTIKCSVQGEPPARFHFNIGISQANYNSGSQEVPGEGICQPRCIGHWLWSSSMSEDQLFHAKAGAGASNTISSNCHVRVSSFEPCRGKCQVTLGCYFRGVIGAP